MSLHVSPCSQSRFVVVPLCLGALSLIAAFAVTAASANDKTGETERGSLRVHRTDDRKQIVEWVGPESAKLSLPRLDPACETFLSLRVVPKGISVVRQIAATASITRLHLHGVAFSDEDFDFVVSHCRNLESLRILHPSAMCADELTDLTAEERKALQSQSLSERMLAKLATLKNLKVLEIGGYRLAPTRLHFLSQLQQLEALFFDDMNISDADLRCLTGLVRLKYLALAGTQVAGGGLRSLGTCHSMNCIVLDRSPVTDQFADYVKDNQWRQLRMIYVHRCKITPRGIVALRAILPPFADVRESNPRIDDLPLPTPCNAQTTRDYRAAIELLSAVSAVASSGDHGDDAVSMVEIRRDRKNWTGDWVFDELVPVKGLRRIKLAGWDISSTILGALRVHKGLEFLDLDGSSIDDSGIQQLSSLTELRSLSVYQPKAGDARVESKRRPSDRCIQSLRLLPELVYLNLGNCAITDEGLKQLAAIESLEILGLDGTKVTDSGVGYLSKLPRLRMLSFRNCQITDRGAAALLECPNIVGYRPEGTKISKELAEKLSQHALDVRSSEGNDRVGTWPESLAMPVLRDDIQ